MEKYGKISETNQIFLELELEVSHHANLVFSFQI